MKYKKGDKVVVEIDHDDAKGLNDEKDILTHYEQVLGKVEDFKPAQEKIKMTSEGKEEFNDLTNDFKTAYAIFYQINEYASSHPYLYNKLFCNCTCEKDGKAQAEFVKALEHPELIEVEHKFKVGDLVKVGENKAVIVRIDGSNIAPFKIMYENNSGDYCDEEELTFIKSGAIDWGDGK